MDLFTLCVLNFLQDTDLEHSTERCKGRGETESDAASEGLRPDSLSPVPGSSLQLNMNLEAILVRAMEELGVLSATGRFPPPLGVSVWTK